MVAMTLSDLSRMTMSDQSAMMKRCPHRVWVNEIGHTRMQEMFAWCDEHVGHDADWVRTAANMFYFADANIAFAFKMRWG